MTTPPEYVTIYCKAQSHAGQPWIIATYTRAWSGQGVEYWRYSTDQYLAGALVRSATRHETSRAAESTAEGTRLLDVETKEGHLAQMRADAEGRAIYAERLRCHLCGDAVKRTTSNLFADLDRLAEAGVSDVPLPVYRAAMR